MNKEITAETVAKALPECTDPETIHKLITLYTTGCKVSLNHRQNLLVEASHKYIGLGSLNKSCGSCMGTALEKLHSYVTKYLPATTYVKKAKVTKKKVKVKAKNDKLFKEIKEKDSKLTGFEPSNHLEAIEEIDPTKLKWAELKKYATSQGVSVYKKNKAEILKELIK